MAIKVLSILRQQTLGAIALFVALGGTSYAVATGSIDSREIKNNTIQSKDIRNNTVRGRDVRNRSLLAQDFKLGELPAGPRGATGATGLRGERGARGAVGPTFASVFSNPQDPAPPATPDTTVLNGQYNHTFVTPTSGRLLVFASLNVLGVTCSVGFGNAFLYLDGVGVPGSGQRQPDAGATADPYTTIALTPVAVPAGQHTLTIALDCPMGNRTADTSSGDGDLGAVLVGG